MIKTTNFSITLDDFQAIDIIGITIYISCDREEEIKIWSNCICQTILRYTHIKNISAIHKCFNNTTILYNYRSAATNLILEFLNGNTTLNNKRISCCNSFHKLICHITLKFNSGFWHIN